MTADPGRTAPLVRACHLAPTVAVTAFTMALALRSGHRWRTLATGAAALSGQLTVGWSNDYLDRERARRCERADKPIVAGEISPEAVRTAAVISGLACVPLSLLSGRRAAAVHGVAVGSALAYNARLKATAASALPYAVAFGALPAVVSLSGRPPRWPAPWAMVAGASLGTGAHFLNALPDVEFDELTSVRGLPQRIGPVRSLATGVVLIAGAAALIAGLGGAWRRPAGRLMALVTGSALGAVVIAGATGRRRRAWQFALGAAAASVGLYVCGATDG